MKNTKNIKVALKKAVINALHKHLEEEGTLKTLDWFNASAETTDFYIEVSKEKQAA